MEPAVVEPPRRRGRKRKNIDVQDRNGQKKVVGTRSLKLVGRYVRKEFHGSGVFLGKISFYDSGLYRINYEDGDCEDLDSSEVKVFLVEDSDLIGEWSERKEKLDKLVVGKDVNAEVLKVENTMEPANVNPVDSLVLNDLSNSEAAANEMADVNDDSNVDADSSSDSCDNSREHDASLDMEEPLVPPPELPPSSGHIGIPEEYVSHLFSVHSFLRSFSVPLFLFPFGLDDFVGGLNCSAANTLLDLVHVALLRALKHHIERLSSDGSELALKCMRCLDWSLLDTLTWPVFLVHYLMVMGYTNGPDWKGFYSHALERDYYTLPAGKKLLILQILCDDVLDSEEIRAEMDMRVESEVGIDIDASPMVTPTGGSRRVHPRYSITSASQDREALQSVAAGGPVGSSIDEDGNGDECRICGMDGLLICCDGCPSSYHSRCLGLNKMHMPEGSWYCPECKINASEPTILQGTTLRGGHNFGVDPYGQVFVATCDHLLVLKASLNSETCLRYYNRQDIPRFLHSLYSKVEHVVTYSEICRGVMQYWELPEDTLPCYVIPEVRLQLSNEKEGEYTTDLDNLLDKSVPEMAEVENTGSCVTGTCAADMAASSPTNCIQKPVPSGNSLDTVSKSDQLGGYTYPTRQQSHVIMQNILVKPTSSSGLIGQPADAHQLSQQSTSNVTETVSYTTRNFNGNYSGTVNGVLVEAKMSLSCRELSNKVDRKSYVNPCMGSSFKPTGYINHYLHGDFAASAAANLAILSSEGNQVPESRSSYNHRKVMSDNVALQVKAFSSASMRFFWPNTEKKLVEVPRERCTWCFSCKAPVASRRGCLLNAAASNAMRGATKVLAGVRPMKNGDGGLLGIAAYIMFMEESLNGLLIGPFLNDTFRRRWRKQVEQATTRNAIKILLLELEENVRTIAYSGDWIKLVDGCSTQSSTSQIAANVAESTQKRRPGRRGRKPSAVAEVASNDYQDKLADFTWWRGGALSKLMFQRGVLPCSMIRKAARQGGLKRITGIHYVEGQETLKISKRLIWRSAVEMSRNLAQLALQVRYFDFHVRWADMVRPEQTPPDGKGDTETSAFRNAFICDKKILEHEVRYCVAFGSQKHLPSRVMKNIAEVEQLGDGKGRYWFSETRIPLYLIKEFEEKVGKSKSVDVPLKLQKMQQKPSHKNMFSYLLRKQDNMLKSSCCSCHQDVLQRNAVKCSACQDLSPCKEVVLKNSSRLFCRPGFCHEQCLTSSTVHMNEEVEFLITCKHCSEARAMTQVQSSYGSPTSPLHLQSRDFSNAGNTKTRGKSAGHKRTSAASAGTLEYSSERKPTTGSAVAKKSKNKHWGLIWRKKNCEDTGIDFRLKNILLKGNPDMDLSNPVCRLCNQPYNADLMYIRCETCLYWYHADAVELDESKIFCLVGFKCSKCRRIKSPVCPYLDPDKKKALEDKIESKAPKVNIHETDRKNSSLISEQLKDERPAYFALDTKSEVTLVAADDPLLLSLSEVEQHTDTSEVDYGWNNSNLSRSGPTKLPVRRHIRQENDLYCPNPSDPFPVDVSAPFETNVFNSTEKLPVRRHVKRENNSDCHFHAEASNPSETNAMSSMEDTLSPQPQWVVSKDNFDDNITLDYDSLGYDDMEFEPQTYFSFNELLASDDGGHANGNGSPGNVTENWESASMLPGNETLEISYDQEEPIITVGTTIEVVPCNICSHSEPCPDLSCQMCGMWIHSHCSPWLESSSHEDGWRCGNCREWR